MRKVKSVSLGKFQLVGRTNVPHPIKPNVVYHADGGIKDKKRWCAKAVLGPDRRYTAFLPQPVGTPGSLVERIRAEAGDAGCALAGFDFPLGIPAFYAKRAGGFQLPRIST